MNELREIAKDKKYREKRKTERDNKQVERWFKITRVTLLIATIVVGGYSMIKAMIDIITRAEGALHSLLVAFVLLTTLLFLMSLFRKIEENLGSFF